MSPLTKKLFIAVVGVQLLILGGMVAHREYILATGVEVLLECTLSKPESPLDGDYYAKIAYKINSVPILKKWDINEDIQPNRKVYVGLEQNKSTKYYEAVAISRNQDVIAQHYSLFIQGELQSTDNTSYHITYGIEDCLIKLNQSRLIEQVPPENIAMSINLLSSGEVNAKQMLINGRPVEELDKERE